MAEDEAESESPERTGGRIPGAPGMPAFRVIGPQPSVVPVVIAVPHAGRTYTSALLRDMRHPHAAALKLEDRYVDKLARAVAAQTGAGLLLAEAPRAMIDLNRAPDDIDWEMFGRSASPDLGLSRTSQRARSGLGLIPRRLPGLGDLWRRRLDEGDLAARIAEVHAPYHDRLATMLDELRRRWGAALLIDLHSMPPLPTRTGQVAAEFVIGDRFGASCHGSLVAAAFTHFARERRTIAHNRPYAGGYVLERHARAAAGVHAMQIEIDRSSYLDRRLEEVGSGFDGVVSVISGLTRRLAGVVAELASDGPSWKLAAE